MARFLVSALGSAGAVHPFVAVSQALMARGHSVRMIASPHFEVRIRAAGVDFAPIGEAGDYERLLQRPELWQPRSGARFVVDELLARLPQAYDVTDGLTTDDTVLVGSTLSWAVRLVQERRGLLAATVHLSPVCMPSASAPPVMPGVGDVGRMPAWSVRLLQWAGERLIVDRLAGPRLNALRERLGLPRVTRIWGRWMHSPDLVVGAWPDWFAPRQADWPHASMTSGFPIFDEGGSSLDSALDAFIAAGPAPIGITPGSAMAHGHAFFAKALDACAALDRRVVTITPYRDQLPDVSPASAHHVAYAPFSALIPRLAALVHHGGIGTSAQALAAGVPQVVVPFAHDQFDNAARLGRLGVAATPGPDSSTRVWSAALERLLSAQGTTSAARRLADRMASAEPGAVTIANRLERLAETGTRASGGRSPFD